MTWYKDFFTDIALEYWQKANPPANTKRELALLDELLSIKKKTKILDVPCGYGRHSIALAQKGMNVTAIDIAQPYIDQLQATVQQQNITLTAICGDILTHTFNQQFDLVLCLGNSFAYFDREQMPNFLQKIHHVLLPKATFVIHTCMLVESLIPNLMEYDWQQAGDITMLLQNTYEIAPGHLTTRVTFLKEGKSYHKTMYHYIYTLSEIVHQLQQSGFEVHAIRNADNDNYQYGDTDTYIVVQKK